MKKISYWAKSHKQSARIIIILSFILLIASGYITGTLINELGITVPAFTLALIVSMYLLALLCYPANSRKATTPSSTFYRWQKTCDVALTASAFLIMLYVSNHQFKDFQTLPISSAFASSSTSLLGDSSQRSYQSIAAFSASLKNEKGETLKWKERKKLLKEQVKAIKKATMSKEGKAGLIILSIILALVLISAVAALSCSLACAGSGAAALIVGLGGTALVVMLLIKSIRFINKKKMTPKPEEPAKTD